MTATSRATTDRTGPRQGFAAAIIEVIQQSGSEITTRVTPAHEGVEGNEMADVRAKAAAEDRPPGD